MPSMFFKNRHKKRDNSIFLLIKGTNKWTKCNRYTKHLSTGQGAERSAETSATAGTSVSHTAQAQEPSQKSRLEVGGTRVKHRCLDTTGLCHPGSHSSCGCLRKTCPRSIWSTFQPGVGRHLVAYTLEVSLTVGGFWGKNSQISLRAWSLVGQPSSSDGLAPMNIWAEQTGLGGLSEGQ